LGRYFQRAKQQSSKGNRNLKSSQQQGNSTTHTSLLNLNIADYSGSLNVQTVIFHKSMVVHSITIFDRKGKTVFTKTFSQAALKQQQILQETGPADPGSDAVTEQRKLVFGMLFSLREILGSLSPEDTLPCKLI
jgi:hypothetical protein